MERYLALYVIVRFYVRCITLRFARILSNVVDLIDCRCLVVRCHAVRNVGRSISLRGSGRSQKLPKDHRGEFLIQTPNNRTFCRFIFIQRFAMSETEDFGRSVLDTGLRTRVCRL